MTTPYASLILYLSEGLNYQKETVLFHNTPTLMALFPSHNFGLLQALSTGRYPTKLRYLDQFMREKRTTAAPSRLPASLEILGKLKNYGKEMSRNTKQGLHFNAHLRIT